jgi:hypothetical protein
MKTILVLALAVAAVIGATEMIVPQKTSARHRGGDHPLGR